MERKDVSFTHERSLVPGLPAHPSYGTSQHRLEISVIFTSFVATAAALKMAGTLVKGLNAHIKLVVPQVVPYPLPLDNPPVLREFCERRLRDIANESTVDTTVLVYPCRNRLGTLRAVLKRGTIVVIGGCRRWWPTAEKSLARQMRRSGHEVIFTEMD